MPRGDIRSPGSPSSRVLQSNTYEGTRNRDEERARNLLHHHLPFADQLGPEELALAYTARGRRIGKVKLNYYHDRTLSDAAADLIQFDAGSISLIVNSQGGNDPETWLADPDAYENNGRVLRDSESPRMLAYSKRDHVLYATDGCNSCSRHLTADLDALSPEELKQFAAANALRLELVEHLATLVRRLPS